MALISQIELILSKYKYAPEINNEEELKQELQTLLGEAPVKKKATRDASTSMATDCGSSIASPSEQNQCEPSGTAADPSPLPSSVYLICPHCKNIFSALNNAIKVPCKVCRYKVMLPPGENEKYVFADCCQLIIRMRSNITHYYCPRCSTKSFAEDTFSLKKSNGQYPVYLSRTLTEIHLYAELDSVLDCVQSIGVDQAMKTDIFKKCEKLLHDKSNVLKMKVRKSKCREDLDELGPEVEVHAEMLKTIREMKKIYKSNCKQNTK